MAKQTLSALGRIDVLVVSGSRIARTSPDGRSSTRTRMDYPTFLTAQLLTKTETRSARCYRACASRAYGKVVVLTTDAGRVPTVSSALFGAAAAGLSVQRSGDR